MTIQMEATEKYFHVVLFILVHMVVLILLLLDEPTVYDHSNGSYLRVLSCRTLYFGVQSGSQF